MNRVLRMLALIGFLSFVLWLVPTFLLLTVSAFRTYAYECTTVVFIVISLAARLCTTSTFAAVVAATVVCLQRRQRGWAGVLIGALLLIPICEYVLFLYLAPRSAPMSSDMLIRVLLPVPSWIQADTTFVVGLVPVVALLPLAYSFKRRPETLPITPAPDHLGMALPLHGITRAFALTGLVVFGVSLALWLSPVWQDLYRNPEGGGLVAALVTLRVRDVGTALALAAAVIAAVAAVQRRQLVWAGMLLGALILVAFEPVLSALVIGLIPRSLLNSHYSPYGIPLVADFVMLSVMLFIQIVVPALPALVYSFSRAPAVSTAVPAPQQ